MPENGQDYFTRDLLSKRGLLVAVARRYYGNADPAKIESAVQSALLKAWKAQESFEMGTNMDGWLTVIMRNHFLSEMRKKSTKGILYAPSEDIENSVAVEEEALDIQSELLETLERMLSLKERELSLLLDASLGLSYEEMAKKHNIPEGTVKSRVSRCRDKLQRFKEAEEADSRQLITTSLVKLRIMKEALQGAGMGHYVDVILERIYVPELDAAKEAAKEEILARAQAAATEESPDAAPS